MSEEPHEISHEKDNLPLRPVFRFQLMRERRFYGTGAHQLLHLIEETGSLLTACRRMDMSYSKGRKVIANLEDQLGFPVIQSRQGGKTGGSSVLTAQATALMQRYDAFSAEAETALQAIFDKHFGSC